MPWLYSKWLTVEFGTEDMLVAGAVICALVIAIGVAFGRVPITEGGIAIISLCGGSAIAKKRLRYQKIHSKKKNN
mgnify:CR=1 FL=1